MDVAVFLVLAVVLFIWESIRIYKAYQKMKTTKCNQQANNENSEDR